MMLVDDNPQGLLEMFKLYQAPKIDKWIDRGQGEVAGGKSRS